MSAIRSEAKYTTLAAAFTGTILVLVAFSSALEQAPVTGGGLTLPPGFEVERVAGPPLVDRPIVADFDEEGRLYVADSSGSNDPVQKQLAERPHRIVRLEDSDGDGRFDKSLVFADRMMFPEGAMWFDGSLYVAAPPSIWRLTDGQRLPLEPLFAPIGHAVAVGIRVRRGKPRIELQRGQGEQDAPRSSRG